MRGKSHKRLNEEQQILKETSQWLRLESYEPSKNFSPAQWGRAIGWRLIVHQFINAGNLAAAQEGISVLMEDPLSDTEGSGFDPVTPVSVGLMTSLSTALALRQQLSPANTLDRHTAVEELLRDTPIMDFGLLRINLFASDNDILHSFEQWLSARRQDSRFAQPRKVRSDQIAHWFNNRFLPYIDLRLWQQFRQVKLTQEALIEILFPNDSSDTSVRIRSLENYWTKDFNNATAWALLGYVRNTSVT